MEESSQSTDAQPGDDGAPVNNQQKPATSGGPKKIRSSHMRTQSRSSQKFTPPPTPKTSRESLQQQEEQENELAKRQRHPPFLRAFYHFHPTFTSDSSTVTLPLNMGDVILVHSIHTNGWADGTLLSSGARGWLPTNYCEFYEAKQIRPLLRSCTVLFEQFRGASVSGPRQSQLAVTHVVAGVKYLLVGVLTRGVHFIRRAGGGNSGCFGRGILRVERGLTRRLTGIHGVSRSLFR